MEHFPSAYTCTRASDEEMKLLQRRWAPTDLRRGAGSRTPAFQPSRHRRAAFAGGRHGEEELFKARASERGSTAAGLPASNFCR